MLSPASYDALLPYRSAPVAVGANGLSEREKDFLAQEYIASHEMDSKTINGVFTIFTISYAITPKGEDALAEYEEARNAQLKIELDKKSEHRFQILLAFLSAILGSLLTLLIEHSDMIIDVLFSLFQ